MRVLIAVAWPYASGPRHLGHVAGAYLPADIAARYHRLAGDDVLMVSGSDCHGTPITVAAEGAGEPPERFAADQHARIGASFRRLGIGFDIYTTTTTPMHRRVAHELFARLHRGGWIEEGAERSAWCSTEERSLPDRYVEGTCPHCGAPDARGDQCDACGRTLEPADLGAPRCRRCGAQADFRDLRQLFLRLDRLQPSVERYLEERSGWREFVLAEALGWVRTGLRPRSITRDLGWGVPVPLAGWEDRRLYVWFEAVIGYLSASVEWAERAGDGDAWREWWERPDAHHKYFLGKDNGPFHAVWWPAILIGAGGLHLPDEVVANHYLTLGAAQMSASRGHGFTVDEGIERLGVDPLRHALCALNPETQDTEFTWSQADDLTRTGLLGCIANPAHRVATLLWRRFGGRVDEHVWASETDAERRESSEALNRVGDAIRRSELRRALTGIHELGRTVNRRLAETEPWHQQDREAHTTLTKLTPYLDALGVASWAVVPSTAEAIRKAFGREATPACWATEERPPLIVEEPRPPLRVPL